MQCRPAPVSSRQDSGVAGPEKGVLYKHKNRIFLICSCRVIICYLLNVLLWGTHLSYRQCRPPPVSSKQDSGRAGPEKSLLYKHKVGYQLIGSCRAMICYLLNLAIGSVALKLLSKHKHRLLLQKVYQSELCCEFHG